MSTLQTAAAMNLTNPRTFHSLQCACVAEMHTHRLYTAFSQQMDEDGLHVVAHAFRYTAAQEKEHADILRGLLSASGESAVPCPEDAPLLLPRDTQELLRAVIQVETNEGKHLYPGIAQTAQEEGYPRVAEACRHIAETERAVLPGRSDDLKRQRRTQTKAHRYGALPAAARVCAGAGGGSAFPRCQAGFVGVPGLRTIPCRS